MRKLFVLLGILAALAVGSPVYATDESTPPSAPSSSAPVKEEPDPVPSSSSSAPTTQPSPRPDCLAYYYTGTKQTLCDRFPRNTKLTCAEAKYRVTLRAKNNDPWGLDGGGANIGKVGIGCESNPLKPHPTPTGTRTTSPAVSGPSLPLTGPGGAVLAIGGVAILVLGGAAVYLTTRRRNKFVA